MFLLRLLAVMAIGAVIGLAAPPGAAAGRATPEPVAGAPRLTPLLASVLSPPR